MKKELKLVMIDYKYCDYLRQFDNKVPYNAGSKEMRPFVGVILEVNNCKYFAPLSSPKPKHLKLNSKLDFFKIDGGKLGAININNMIPVTNKNVTLLNLTKHCNTIQEFKYQKLLKGQLYWLNRNKDVLYYRTSKLYYDYINDTLQDSVRKRCCNFKLLEEKCLEYNKTLVSA